MDIGAKGLRIGQQLLLFDSQLCCLEVTEVMGVSARAQSLNLSLGALVLPNVNF